MSQLFVAGSHWLDSKFKIPFHNAASFIQSLYFQSRHISLIASLSQLVSVHQWNFREFIVAIS
jgi:hypothetical protein